VIKGIRKHKGLRFGEVRYNYSHYFVRLEEGTPPKDYYKLNPKSPAELLENWKSDMRKRKIPNSL
jgi:large subunit ribosomal protein L22